MDIVWFGWKFLCLCCNLGLRAFFELPNYLARWNLDNVDDSWNLAMFVTCGIDEWILIWILWVWKPWKFDVWAWLNKFIFDECKNFVGMCKSYPMGMEIFVGMGMKKKKKIVLLGMEKFCLDIEISCWSWNIFLLVMEKFCLDMEIFVSHGRLLFGHWIFCWSWDFFVGMSILGWVFCGHLDDWPTLFCRTLRVKAASRCWKAIWEILSSDIKNIIDEAGF